MTTVRDEAGTPRGLRWRVVGVATLLSAATAGWLLGSGVVLGTTSMAANLIFAFGLGAACCLAIDQLVRRALAEADAERATSDTGAAASGSRLPPGLADPAAESAAALHDVNNVLASIAGHADLALAKLPTADESRPEIEGIARAVERCRRLASARASDGLILPAPLELNELVREMRPMLERLLGDSTQLVIVPGAARSLLLADLGQVERLILNLAVNARDAMPDGGVLRIITENVERPPDPERSDPGGVGVALIVQDTGRGMDAATRARLFEPGFSTRPAGQPGGLGLSIVAEAARQTSATIECRTAPGRGTTFRVVFPLAQGHGLGDWRDDDDLDELPEAPAPIRAPDRRNRILVIDDDTEVRRVVHGLLEAAGFQVVSAPDGAQALALLEYRMVDAVLCDIFMPNKEGIETCSELRRRYPALRVVAMSGASGASGYLRAAEKLGAVASLHKPFTGQELVAVVQGALAGRLGG